MLPLLSVLLLILLLFLLAARVARTAATHIHIKPMSFSVTVEGRMRNIVQECAGFCQKYRIALPDYGELDEEEGNTDLDRLTWMDLAACSIASFELDRRQEEEEGGDAELSRDAQAVRSMLKDMPSETCMQAYTAALVLLTTNMKKFVELEKAGSAATAVLGSTLGLYKAYERFVNSVKKSAPKARAKQPGVVVRVATTIGVAQSLSNASSDMYEAIFKGANQDVLKSSIAFANSVVGAVSYASQGASAGGMLAAAGEMAALASPLLAAMSVGVAGLSLYRVIQDAKYHGCPCDAPFEMDGSFGQDAYCYYDRSCSEEFGPGWSRTGEKRIATCKRDKPCEHTYLGACDCRKTYGKCYKRTPTVNGCERTEDLLYTYASCKDKPKLIPLTKRRSYTGRHKRSDGPLSCAWSSKACQYGFVDVCAEFYNRSVLDTFAVWKSNRGLGKEL